MSKYKIISNEHFGIDKDKFEKQFNCLYLGEWALSKYPNKAFAVGYTDTPDISKGHKNFVIMFRQQRNGLTVSGMDKETGLIEAWHDGILNPDTNEILVSKHRHDYLEKDGCMIDGGKAYTRYGGLNSVLVKVNLMTEEVKFD